MHLEDVDPEEQASRAEERTYIDAMRQVQESLECELRGRMRTQDRVRLTTPKEGAPNGLEA
jgi:hypothetical protein